MATTYTTREIAERLDTEPKVLRRFLRSEDSPIQRVGKGNRYQIEARQLKSLKKRFIDWQSSHSRRAA